MPGARYRMRRQIKNDFRWSISRDGVFRECPRKYYFCHYGFWSGWEIEADPRTRRIYILKQLRNRHTWIGQVVHECIARSLSNLARGVPLLPVDEILSITRGRMRQDFRDSRSGRYRHKPKECCGLFEHEYQMEVSDEEWKDAADTVELCLRNFYESDVFEHFKTLRPINFLETEEFASFRLDDIDIAMKLDCAIREGETVTVWDWKTGRREANTGLSLQMACYALYVKQVHHTPLANIRTRRFDLYRSRIHDQRMTPRSLDEILSYIRGSAKDMRGMLDDVPNNVATEGRFSKVEKPGICLKCNFLGVCEPDI